METVPAIILVQPQMGENIGAAARAMLNFSLTDLRLVDPRDGWPNQRAVDMAAGALDHIPSVQVFSTLADAISDRDFVFGTSARPREMNKPIVNVRAACAKALSCGAAAFVFGPERTGLNNDDLALCHEMIGIPTNPDFSSLNLGQAVLLVAYEWFQTHQAHQSDQTSPDLAARASQDQLEAFFVRLEDELDQKHFFRSENLRPTMRRNIRTMLMRAELSAQEVQTFQGIVSALIGNKIRKN